MSYTPFGLQRCYRVVSYPYPVVAEGLPQPWDGSKYFYGYACKKKGVVLSTTQGEKAQMPESWKAATKEAVAR